jgi:ABC-type multidrug transport system permease subunit
MHFVWSALCKDIQRQRRDPWDVLLWAGIPLLIGVLITAFTGGVGGSAKPTAHLLVADEDDSIASQFLVRTFDQGVLRELIRTERVERAQGTAQIENGEATALLVVPAGFGAALLREEQGELYLLENPAQRLLPQIVEEVLEVALDAAFYVHRLVGQDLQHLVKRLGAGEKLTLEQSGQVGTALYQFFAQIGPYLLPPALEVVAGVDESEESAVHFSFYFFPGFVLMALFFAAQSMGTDIWEEYRQGALRRLVASPASLSAWLLGKVGAGFVSSALVGGILLLFGVLYHGRPLLYMVPAVLWTAAGGALLLLLVMAVQLAVGSERAAMLTTQIAMFPLLMVGGSFFPLPALPSFLAVIGRWTPNGYVLTGLTDILLGRMAALDMLAGLGVLVVVCIALFALCALRLSRLAGRG